MVVIKYAVLFIIVSLLSIFTFAKPTKIFYPQVTGVECVEQWLCIDDKDKLDEAIQLYENAFKNVENKLTKFVERPTVIFCSTLECFTKFGFEKAAAKSIGGFGVVVAPRGWTVYFVEHEMIHEWQVENFGLTSIVLAPKWLKEGMAYSVSDDPREVLEEPFESFRKQYEEKFGLTRGAELIALLENEL